MNLNWSDQLEDDILEISRAMSSTSISFEQLAPGERREVAILFLDLSGFTTLSEELDHETVHRLATGIMRAMSRIVEAGGGYIDKYEGDKIMALFGAIHSFPDDCTRAVSAAVRMLETVDQIKEIMLEKGIVIGARAGISYGSVTVAPDPSGHLTASGDEVNVASRLETTAEVGTVQVSSAVMERCTSGFSWIELGERKLKGRKRSVLSFRPVEALPALNCAVSPTPDFTGRKAVLSFLETALDSALLNPVETSRMLVLKGPSGVGKTTLAHVFASGVKEKQGIHLLSGEGSSFTHKPFEMWINALAPLFPREGGCLEEFPIDVSDKAECLKHLLYGSNWEYGEKLSSESKREHCINVLSEVLLELSKKNFLIIADDLHWMDSASAEVLMKTVTSCSEDNPLMIVGCLSTASSVKNREFEKWLASAERVSIWKLNSLSKAETEELIGKMVPSTVPISFTDEVFRRSGGNPFIVVELIRHLLETEILSNAATPGGWGEIIPESVRGLIRTRIDSLPSGERKSLQLASILGERFTEELFLTVTSEFHPWSTQMAEGYLGMLEQRRILERITREGVTSVRFANLFYQEVASTAVLRQNRASISRSAAVNLTELYGEEKSHISADIASYWKAAGLIEKSLEEGMNAMKYYSDSYQNRECVLFASTMKKWISCSEKPFDDEMMEIFIKEQRIFYRTGEYTMMKEVLTEQLLLAEKRQNLSEMGKTYCSLGELERKLGNTELSKDYLEKSCTFSEQGGDLHTLGMSLSNLGALYSGSDSLEKSQECFNKAVEIQRRCGNLKSAAVATGNLAAILLRSGDKPLALKRFNEALQLFRETDHHIGQAHVLCNMGFLLEEEGRNSEAMSNFSQAVKLNRETGHTYGLAWSLAALGRVQISLSDIEEGEDKLKEVLEITEKIKEWSVQIGALIDLSISAISRNSLGEAVDLFNRAAGHEFLRDKPPYPAILLRLESLKDDLREQGVDADKLITFNHMPVSQCYN